MPDNMEPRVSYLITTRNRASFLDRTLRNVREFLTPSDELIVVDGASTDNTLEIVAQHRDIVTQFLSEPDFGEAHGYNKAILLSRGWIIKFITDDDYIYPQAMAKTIEFLVQHDEIDALLCGGEAIAFDPITNKTRFLYYQHLAPSRRLEDGAAELFRETPCGVGLVLTRRMIARVGLLDTTYLSVDANYMSRLLACGVNFRYLDVKLFRQTVYPHSLQNDVAGQQRDAIRLILNHKTWPILLGQPLAAVADGLGLSALPAGSQLMRWIYLGERLRSGRRAWVLKLFVGFLDIVFAMWDWGWRIKNNGFDRTGAAAMRPTPEQPAEPIWDGGFR